MRERERDDDGDEEVGERERGVEREVKKERDRGGPRTSRHFNS